MKIKYGLPELPEVPELSTKSIFFNAYLLKSILYPVNVLRYIYTVDSHPGCITFSGNGLSVIFAAILLWHSCL
jgi:hypothetical protein